MPWDHFYLLSFNISVHSSSSGFPPWFSFLFVFIRGSLLLMFVHSVIKKQLPYWKQGLWVSSSYLIHPLLKQYDKSYIWKEIKDKAFKKKKHLNVRLMFIFTYISVEAPKFSAIWANLGIEGLKSQSMHLSLYFHVKILRGTMCCFFQSAYLLTVSFSTVLHCSVFLKLLSTQQ